MPYVYQCVVADGFTYSVERNDQGSPSFPGYWPSLRMDEVGCPICYQTGHIDDRECPECCGSGLTTGTDFTIYRYEVPEELLATVLDDPGDGYEYTTKLHELLGDGVVVLDWEPERQCAE